MAIVDPNRLLIFEEGVRFRSAVSEEVAQRLGSSLNQVALYQYDTKDFFLNGPYGDVGVVPTLGLDGLFVFPFDSEIINIAMFNLVAGSSGTTELDIKMATTSGGAFTSIFSTTPKISSAASSNAFFLCYTITQIATGQSWALNGSPPAGVTVGSLTSVPLSVPAGTALRIDLMAKMTDAENCGLMIFHRPA